MASPSTLTCHQFEHACKALVAKHAHSASSSLNTVLKGWSWTEHPTVPGLGYLSRTSLIQGLARISDSDLLEDGIPEPEEVVEDPALAHDTSAEYLTCGQSVTFSPTFQVPVFYFTVHDRNGSPLMLKEIMKTSLLRRHALPETQVTSFALKQPNSQFPLLSQGDHPTTGTPAWFIHPCGTACAIGELIGEKITEAGAMPDPVDYDEWLNWLETWFMVLGNIVEL
ncbi:hypothetical protein F5148DRAFT_976722 [Russula earlei]|uniref:Uncharacterized protein n=1 Tax=Russula earlei TaxID=71964 RepID=A0ACC0UG20_9AGAM|nr:hypothetical protein F5148DRAFT_976722 [Russula earlei]